MASKAYQDKWCIREATASEYALLDEIISDTLELVQWNVERRERAVQRARPDLAAGPWTPVELKALQRFLDLAGGPFTDIPWHEASPTIEQLVHEDPRVARIRDAAQACLDAYGVSVALEEIEAADEARS